MGFFYVYIPEVMLLVACCAMYIALSGWREQLARTHPILHRLAVLLEAILIQAIIFLIGHLFNSFLQLYTGLPLS